MPFMFKQTSTSLILLGILAVIVGIVAIAWPSVTVYALVLLFAVYAFLDAGLQAARAFSSRTAGPVFGYLLLSQARTVTTPGSRQKLTRETPSGRASFRSGANTWEWGWYGGCHRSG